MFWILLGCALLLLLFPAEVSAAAADGAMLWWTRVLPALLPHLILSRLALAARPALRTRFLHPYALLSGLFGMVGGYPVGAIVLAHGEKAGLLGANQAQRFSYASGWMSPAFLTAFTAIGLFHCPAAVPILAAAVYPAALGTLLFFGRSRPAAPLPPAAKLTAEDVFLAIGASMQALLNIGGCIVLCRVADAALEGIGLVRLLGHVFPEPIVRAILGGLLEMTSGCALAADLALPLPVRLALCVFFEVFGGASVLLQTRAFLPRIRYGRYVLVRLALALVCGLSCYALALLLPVHAIPASAAADSILRRGTSLLALLLPCLVGLSAVLYLPLLSAKHRA